MSVQLVRELEEPSYHGTISLVDVLRAGTMPFKNPEIKKVIFNDPATIILWKDGTKTVVKCQEGDVYDKKIGFLLAIAKKYFGNTGKFNNFMRICLMPQGAWDMKYADDCKLCRVSLGEEE